MATHEQASRLDAMRQAMKRHGLSTLLVTHLPNVRYLCGFTGSNGVLLVASGEVTLFTDSRYRIQAREQVKAADIMIPEESVILAAAERIREKKSAKVGLEAESLNLSQVGLLRKVVGRGTKLQPTSGIVASLRSVKSNREITLVSKAAQLICRVFEGILEKIRPGAQENHLAAEIDYSMRCLGAEGPSFETIVASGPRSALPHARPSTRKLQKGELVILDMGAILHGYCSDLTRTVHLGRASAQSLGWYRAVWEAHGAARGAIRAGVAAGEVDGVARSSLDRAGLGKFFAHSTGHGIGLEIHEVPRLAKGQKAPLVAGNIITVEPGIYIEGVGGVRIEDDVLVTPNGHKVLTRMCGELLQL